MESMKIKPSIFVVEDDHFFSQMVVQKLNQHHLEDIEVYHNGEEALSNLSSQPDIVILDHKLGETSGLEVLKRIKRLNSDIDVIFLSAQEKMSVVIQALKDGAFDYLDKNQNGLNRLIHIINQVQHVRLLNNENKRLKRQERMVLSFLGIYSVGILVFVLKYKGLI